MRLPHVHMVMLVMLVLSGTVTGSQALPAATPARAAGPLLNPRLITEIVTIPGRAARDKRLRCPRRFSAISGSMVPVRIEQRVNVVVSAPTDASGKIALTRSGDRPTNW